MKLSIIIPIYNVELYLSQCLDSVFVQDLTDCEVICVNDGSTDNSGTILEEYQRLYSGLSVVNQSNSGLSVARNSGLRIAKGEYIYFLDSDDYLLPDFLEKIYQGIQKNVDIVSYNVLISEKGDYYFNNRKKIDKIYTGQEYFENYYIENAFFPTFPVWMYLYKKSFLENNHLVFKENSLHEDIDFTSRSIYLAESVCQIDKPIQFHRVLREGAITQTIRLKNLGHIKQILLDLFEFYRTNNCTKDIYYQYLFSIFLSIMLRLGRNYPENMRTFFSLEDYNVMRLCVKQKSDYTNYYLFRHFPKVFLYYNNKNSNIFIRKIIKNIFRLY